MGALALSTADLSLEAGEPRVRDLRLGELLGFGKPVRIRTVINRNFRELEGHGRVASRAIRTGRSGRPETAFYLNEAQALLVCMFSRTNEAAEARKQIIQVFLAYRHGKLAPTVRKTPPANDRNAPWEKMKQRNSHLRDAMALQDLIDMPKFARAIAYVPTILYLDLPDGRRRRQRRPRWWHDLEVRQAGADLHRQMTIDLAIETLRLRFGNDRASSRSSLARYWLTLDQMRAAS